jgi:hypothetical protein
MRLLFFTPWLEEALQKVLSRQKKIESLMMEGGVSWLLDWVQWCTRRTAGYFTNLEMYVICTYMMQSCEPLEREGKFKSFLWNVHSCIMEETFVLGS